MRIVIVFMLLLSPLPAFACLNYLNVDEVVARRACGASGSFKNCEHLKLSACSTGKCACYDDIPIEASSEVQVGEKWEVVAIQSKMDSYNARKDAEQKELEYTVRAVSSLVEVEVAKIKAEEAAKVK